MTTTTTNPLLRDPTRTTLLRRRFVADFYKRVRKLKGKIRKLIVEEDAFGLVPDKVRREVLGNSLLTNQRWRFNTDQEKVQEFQKWLEQEIELEIFAGATQEEIEQAYWYQYIQEGYQKGWARSFDDANAQGVLAPSPEFFQGSRQEFLRQSFGPQSVERTKLIASRVFTDLKGFSDAMSQQLTRGLADGFTQGKGPRDIARDLNKTVDNLEKKRARAIARTEVIRAHAEGQLDSIERLGVTEVGVQVEWSTTGDDLVCPLCQPLEGVVITTKEARGILPRHPNCRCAFIPANVGETKDPNVKESKAEIQDALDESIRREIPKGDKDRTLEEQKERTRWLGADVKPKENRPEPKLQGPATDTKKKTPKTTPTETREKTPRTVSSGPKPVTRPDNRGKPVKDRIAANTDAQKVRKNVIKLGEDLDKQIQQLEKQIEENYNQVSGMVRQQIHLNNKVVDEADRLGLTITEYEKKFPEVIKEIEDLDKASTAIADSNAKLSYQLKEAQTRKTNAIRELLRVDSNVENLGVVSNPSKPTSVVKSIKPEVRVRLTPQHAEKTEQAADFVRAVTAADDEVASINVKSFQLKADHRAHAINGEALNLTDFDGIYCVDDNSLGIFIHELGHHIEYKLPEVQDLANEFLEYRTAGQQKVQFKKLFPNSKYEDDEYGIKDEFDKAFSEHSAWYIGKIYEGRGSTEIVSMGLQKLYEDPLTFAKLDPEYFDFMIGILRRTL